MAVGMDSRLGGGSASVLPFLAPPLPTPPLPTPAPPASPSPLGETREVEGKSVGLEKADPPLTREGL